MRVTYCILTRLTIRATVAVSRIIRIVGADAHHRRNGPTEAEPVGAAEVMVDLGVVPRTLIAQILIADIILYDSIAVQKIRCVGLGHKLHELGRGGIDHRCWNS